MKKIIDIIQIVLLDSGGISFISWVLVAWAVLQAIKVLFLSSRAVYWMLAKWCEALYLPKSIGGIFGIFVFGLSLYCIRSSIVNEIQYVEERYLAPTYVVPDSSAWAVSVYENQLRKYTSEAGLAIVRDSTRALAAELGCSPLDIYEVAYSECGMNPFCVRADGVAAGWIQFTRIGLADVRLSGRRMSLDDVKNVCRDKDARTIMALTGAYMRIAAKGRKLPTSTDVYCAVFAPGKIDHDENQTLYAGWDNPNYTMNQGLDGYFQDGENILNLPGRRDGRLTKKDLRSALAYKKAKLLSRSR